MRYTDIIGDPTNGAAARQAQADKIAKATERKQVANQRYQAKIRAAQDAAKLAATVPNPVTAQERRSNASRRMADARGVLQRTVSAADDTINNALKRR